VSFLLDTNVVSEWTRPRPSAAVAAWLAAAEEDRVFISVATLAELRDGIDRLPMGARRQGLDTWLGGDLPLRFEGRILGVDPALADSWGRVLAIGRAKGRPIGTMDALLAATAGHYGLTLVTRNTRDFQALGIAIVDPWNGG
jgi:predicted nucleic acid-binding protein